jgi:hypothetical protein
MKYYSRVIHGEETPSDVWEIENEIAQRIDVVPSDLGTHRAESGEDVLTTLRKRFQGSDFYELEKEPGEYFPCMARPSTCAQADSPGHSPDKSDKFMHARATSSGQLHSLIGQLEQICRVVHPGRGCNQQAFGHEIRNVLILASTEVELQWKTVMAANGVERDKLRSTRDYVKLARPMKLAEYCVELPYYPWLPSIKPFEKWGHSTDTSKDLGWYAAYNNVKHDREFHFADATLERAFQAVTAFFVMLCAQYGWDFALKGDASFRAFLRLSDAPTWDHSEIYVPPYNGSWRAKDYNFEKKA